MKPILLSLALVAATTTAVPVFAAEPPPPPAAGHGEFGAKLQEIVAQLGLSDEQKSKIAPILQQEGADLRAVREDASLRRLQKARRAREINQKASEQIRALLNPDQQKKYDELRAAAREEMKQKMKERRAAGGS